VTFQGPLFRATLILRYKRFLADCRLDSGEVITTACPNTGSLLGCCEPGSTVWLSHSTSATRKYPYTWELVERPFGLVGINTARPNAIVEAAIVAGTIARLSGYAKLRREVKYGINSRIDMLLSDEDKPDCYVEVKNVTFIRKPELAEFPDCRTERGEKHLREMSDMVKAGHRAVMVYLVQCAAPTQFTLARDLDPAYAKAYLLAWAAGVEALALSCNISTSSIVATHEIPILPL
jgi:sugar fermentation stimulation protein A